MRRIKSYPLWRVGLVLTAAGALVTGCDGGRSAGPRNGALSDEETFAVMMAASEAEVMEGQPAQEQGASELVQRFGSKLIFDQTAALKHLQDLGLARLDNALSQLITAEAKQTVQTLRGLSGSAFDHEFIDHEISVHSAMVDLVQSSLLPYSRGATLHAELTVELETAKSHLNEATTLQGGLH